MEQKAAFNINPGNYDKFRPQYCAELFRDIINFSTVGEGSCAVEIGTGTGLATEPILKCGAFVNAVEYGDKLALYSAEKFKAYSNFKVHNMPFEEYETEENSVDLAFSATAFHWINEAIGYTKVYNMLKPGGVIALFWNRPVPSPQKDGLHLDIQKVYDEHKKLFGNPKDASGIEKRKAVFEKTQRKILEYGFEDLHFKLYNNNRKYKADEYICLLETYSDHALIPEPDKTEFYKQIKAVINKHGGEMYLNDTIDAYMARKPV